MPDPKKIITRIEIQNENGEWVDMPYVPGMNVKRYFKDSPTRKPIYTSNPNDPRIRSYQDSLTTYNLAPEYNKRHLETFFSTSPPNITKSLKEWRSIKEEFKKKGFNESLGRTWVGYGRDDGGGRVLKDYKKPVQPVIYKPSEPERPKVDKATVNPKGASLSVKKKDLQPQKSLPKSVTGFKMDASGANVYLSVNGKQTVMPKKEFTEWLKNPDNRAMYDRYRASQTKTLKKK